MFTAQKEWINRIDWVNLKWNVLEKAKKGAYASFLGLEIRKNLLTKDGYAWRAVAIGDCCMFLIKNQKIIDSFPIKDSSLFGSMPSMLPSISTFNALGRYKIDVKEGKIKRGEIIILATDALAKWIIQQSRISRDLIFLDDTKLNLYFEELIKNGKLKNDDITFFRLIF